MGNATFAKRFRELRTGHGNTLEELSEKLGIGKTAISNWERQGAVPNDAILTKISKLYGVSIDYLIGNDKDGKVTTIYRKLANLSDSDLEKAEKLLTLAIQNYDSSKEDDDDI